MQCKVTHCMYLQVNVCIFAVKNLLLGFFLLNRPRFALNVCELHEEKIAVTVMMFEETPRPQLLCIILLRKKKHFHTF